MRRNLAAFQLGWVGFILGGFIGFLLRPSAFLVGQLSFSDVITRGRNLQGLDQLLAGVAERSFNIMLSGAVIGLAIGALLGLALRNFKAM